MCRAIESFGNPRADELPTHDPCLRQDLIATVNAAHYASRSLALFSGAANSLSGPSGPSGQVSIFSAIQGVRFKVMTRILKRAR